MEENGLKKFSQFKSDGKSGELNEYFVEGLIHITNLPKDYYVFDPKTHLLVGENRGKQFGLNDKIRIRVARVDMDDRKIDFELLSDD